MVFALLALSLLSLVHHHTNSALRPVLSYTNSALRPVLSFIGRHDRAAAAKATIIVFLVVSLAQGGRGENSGASHVGMYLCEH